jgi:hypothetical protein
MMFTTTDVDPPGATNTEVFAMNDNGHIVGIYTDATAS